MAAPVSAQYTSYTFRDAKGQVSRLRVLIGAASLAAVNTAAGNLSTALSAMSNAHVFCAAVTTNPDHTRGAAAVYQDTVDKAILTFTDPAGSIHRFQIPAPKAATFQTDGETVNAAETNTAAVIAIFAASVYGRASDTAPLVYVAGTRIRRKMIRKFNIFTLDPTETIPGE